MIPAEIRYKTQDGELLAIVKAFKTCKHYLEGFQHKVFVLTNHNNLCQFMKTKNLSSRQVCWAQKLFYYHFQIDYYQGKANKAANTSFRYSLQSAKEEKTLFVKNDKILHRLHSLLARISGFLASQLSSSQLSLLHQILICKTTVFPQLRQFWNSFQNKIACESPYANIKGIRLQLSKL